MITYRKNKEKTRKLNEIKEKINNKECTIEIVSNTLLDDENISKLLKIKSLFEVHLPRMPTEYITRLVLDPYHKTLAISIDDAVIAAVCFRCFKKQEIVEMVFFAVNSDNQVSGYGSYLMCDFLTMFKGEYTHVLTYADNFAINFFRKHGFSTQINCDYSKWKHRIKDYTGGTLMECEIGNYVSDFEVQAKIDELKKELLDGLKCFEGQNVDSISDLEGLREVGWTNDDTESLIIQRRDNQKFRIEHTLAELKSNEHSWPFLEPVDVVQFSDYTEIVSVPMDLSTIQKKFNAKEYKQFEEFEKDFRLMIENCKEYNDESSKYAKAAQSLEEFFNELSDQ